MGIIGFLLIVIVVGLIVWLAMTYVPMPAQFRTALPVIAIALLVLVLVIYIFGGMGDVMIPRVR